MSSRNWQWNTPQIKVETKKNLKRYQKLTIILVLKIREPLTTTQEETHSVMLLVGVLTHLNNFLEGTHSLEVPLKKGQYLIKLLRLILARLNHINQMINQLHTQEEWNVRPAQELVVKELLVDFVKEMDIRQ